MIRRVIRRAVRGASEATDTDPEYEMAFDGDEAGPRERDDA